MGGFCRAWVAALFLSCAWTQEEVKAPATATITGLVRFKGPQPARKPLDGVAGNAFCKECHKQAAPPSESWVFGKNGEEAVLQNVLVYVSNGLEGRKFEPPKERVVLDQAGCLYTPHVVALMTGQTLEVRNSDATLHNVMASPMNNKSFNLGMPVKGGTLERIFPNRELRIAFRCFMHPWMLAWVHVLDHPFFAVTGGDGAFTIRNLPPGEYELTVLHEASRFAADPDTIAVKVAAGETKRIEFVYEDKER